MSVKFILDLIVRYIPVAQYLSKPDESQSAYLRESIFVTFGIEPILAYLWARERELNNIRTILIAKLSGVAGDEIKKYLRGVYG